MTPLFPAVRRMRMALRRPTARLAALAWGCAALAGCLDPRPDTSRYYTLPPVPASTAAPAAAAPPMASLGLGPVALPPYLDRQDIATRTAPEQLAYSGQDRWAAPLSDLFWQSLSEELRARVPVREVVPWPWPRSAAPPLAVTVTVLRFERDSGGAAVLDARWTVTAGSGDEPLASGETHAREPWRAGDTASSVSALGRAVGVLAGDVARALSGLSRR